MSRKKALGMGLDALLGSGEHLDNLDRGTGDESAHEVGTSLGDGTVLSVAVERIKPNPNQPRKVFNDDALEELAQSVKQQGVIQPVIVEFLSDGTYQLVAGERRWRASRRAGLDEIPVIVREFTEEEKIGISLVENIQREDLSAIEEARAYQFAIDRLGFSQQELADRVGRKRSTVANSLRLLKLSSGMQEAIAGDEITAGHARALLSVDGEDSRQILFGEILREALSVREAEQRALKLNRGLGKRGAGSGPPKNGPGAKDPELQSLEREFIDLLGTKVSLQGNMERGRMEVSWFNREDLHRIYDRFSAQSEGGG